MYERHARRVLVEARQKSVIGLEQCLNSLMKDVR